MQNLPKIFLGVLTAVISIGSAQRSFAADWETVMTCDGGAAILQVNKVERRNFQFVIKDPNIIVYFNGTGAFRNAGSNFGNGHEFIVGGWLQNGVFSKDQFVGAEGNYNSADSFTMTRENSTLKIELRNILAWSVCDGDISPSTGMCSGQYREGTTTNDYANWYFHSCN